MRASRLGDAPLVSSASCDRIGDNLNGPSVIEVPDWVPAPLGRYYMYFAHHKGRYLRLAYADQPEGPWQVHRPGVLDVTETPFVHDDLDPLDVADGDWVAATGGAFLYAHVASPDVHVDPEARLIRLYYHGLEPDAAQLTRHAVSDDGLSFRNHSAPLALPYLRVFRHGGWVYGIAWGGALYRARAWEGPFERGPDVFLGAPLCPSGTSIRHVAVCVEGDHLALWFTRIGDAPEHVLRAEVALGADWTDWAVGTPQSVLSPELDWEGASAPLEPSCVGTALPYERALRDPFVFKDLLYYCGAGEAAIGGARLAQG